MNRSIGEKVAVCLLTYNHVDVIESTIRSILNQTVTGYEIIVSDDCSTDGTWERVQTMAAADARIRPVRTPRNLGMPGNANFAVLRASRPYVALLHHDDLYSEVLLEKWATTLEHCRGAAFVFNPYGKYKSDRIDEEVMPGECLDGGWLLKRHLFGRWGCVVRGTAMIRRSAWEHVGGMREQFGLLADVDLWMRLAMRWPVAYVPEPVIVVRHQRPSHYPDIYTGNEWHWERQRLLYEIEPPREVRRLFCRESRRDGELTRSPMVLGLEFSGWHVADRLEQPLMVEPMNPSQGGVFDGVQAAPRSALLDQLGLVQADDALRHRLSWSRPRFRPKARPRPRPAARCSESTDIDCPCRYGE